MLQLLSVTMLAGYSDSDGSDDGDLLPVASCPRSIWQSGDRRHSVAHAWSEVPPNLEGLLEGVAEDTVPFSPAEQQSDCVVEKLLRVAFLVNDPQKYCPEPKRKRRRGKYAPELGTLLAQSMRSPTTDVAPHFDSKERRLGYHEFERRLALDMKTSIRDVRNKATQLWRAAVRASQNGWAIMAKVTRVMYSRVGHRTRVLQGPPGDDQSPPPEDGMRPPADERTCLGVLCTWMLELGLQDADVLALVAEGHRGEALRSRLVALPLYEQAFASFTEFVVSKAEALSFGSQAASMELCMAGSMPHRVHVHAFLGPHVDFVAWDSWSPQKGLAPSDMFWGGCVPHLRLLRPRRANRALHQETIGGLYYVLMEKPGTMFRSGNRWPFKDMECHGLWSIVYVGYTGSFENLWFIRMRKTLLLSGLLRIGCFSAPCLCFLSRDEDALYKQIEVVPAGVHHNVIGVLHSHSSVPYVISDMACESRRGL